MNSKNKTSNTLPYSSVSYMQNVSVFPIFSWTELQLFPPFCLSSPKHFVPSSSHPFRRGRHFEYISILVGDTWSAVCQGLLPSRRHIEKREDPGDEVGFLQLFIWRLNLGTLKIQKVSFWGKENLVVNNKNSRVFLSLDTSAESGLLEIWCSQN